MPRASPFRGPVPFGRQRYRGSPRRVSSAGTTPQTADATIAL